MAGGFMSPGLGFASTIGAAIGGAARQANTNIETANAQAGQDEKIWAAQFAKGQEQYEKEKKDYSKKSEIFNSFSKASPNKAAVDAAMVAWESNPKEYREIYSDLVKNGQQGTPEGYNSTYMQGAQSGINSRYQALQQMRTAGTGGGSLRKYFPMPQAPEFGDTYFRPNSAIGPSTPNQAPQAVTEAPVQPGSALDTQIGNAPAAGEPIPLDRPGQVTTTTTDTPLGQPPVQTAQATPGGFTFTPKGQQMTPYQAGRLRQGEDQKQIDRERLELQRQQRPATPQDAAEMKIAEQDAMKYLHDPKTGLQARYSDLTTLTSQAYDVNNIMGTLERGLKASSIQPAFDELNRFTSSALGINLAELGVSNQVSDVQTLKKNVANAIIERLKTLHFGRITNYEAKIVGQGMTQTSNDPTTNLKIALTLQHSVQTAMNMARQEYNTYYFDTPGTFQQKMDASRRVAAKLGQEYSQEQAPWPQLDGKKLTPEQARSTMPTGQWIEDTSDGTMYYKTQEGKIKRAGDAL